MKRFIWLLTGLLALFLLVSCTQPEPDQVTIQLKWLHSAQFAGVYIAQEQGFYAEENIELTIKPGGFGEDGVINVVDEVMSGQAEFGIWSGDSLLRASSEGQPVKAISAIFQINPTAYFSLAENNIETPADLAGKRIASANGNLFLHSVLHSSGLTIDNIEIFPLESDMTPLLNGEVDVWSGYLTEQVARLEAEGYELNVILAYDYGAFIYSDILFTTDNLVQENPDLVERFVRATMRGWEYALANPDEAVAATLKIDPSLDEASLEREMRASIPLIDAGQSALGLMDDTIWETTQSILIENELLEAPLDLTTLYTNEFVAP
ncbi:ABC transporter substrate-binding protein [Candidatus Leptofilum sp.]|uniref:ABC transporter substrate-binding protein n=1 Tax=Candidatus Leptofilum sp. TaxID=3241576 RepID=UPI003B590A9B